MLPMYECPHCYKLGVNLRAKLFGNSLIPARCIYCEKESSIKLSVHGAILFTLWTFLLIFTVLFIVFSQDYSSLLMLLVFVGVTLVYMKLKPLEPMTKQAKLWNNLLSFGVILVLLFAGVLAAFKNM